MDYNSTIICQIDDFKTILKILSSGNLKNDIIWRMMQDWMNVDTFNRLTHFKQLFKECFLLDYQSREFVENEVFLSEIFRLLPLEFQTELKKFAKKVFQSSFNELPESEDEPPQHSPVSESISLSKTALHFVAKEAKQLLVCIDIQYGSVQFYDPQHNSWHSSRVLLPLPNKQKYFQFALLGSMLYAFGGEDKNGNTTKQMWSRDLSDPSSQWTARADMKQSRKWFSSVVLNDNIYALGGWGKNGCERYCSQLNEWSTVADMNSYRDGASAAVINGCIYVAGGWNRGVFKSVSKYCPETDTWREVAPMTTKRYVFSLTPFAGRLWAIGGKGGDFQPLSSCESYDPVTDTWREEAPMKVGRWCHAAIEFNGELYVVGGSKSAKRKYNEKVFL